MKFGRESVPNLSNHKIRQIGPFSQIFKFYFIDRWTPKNVKNEKILMIGASKDDFVVLELKSCIQELSYSWSVGALNLLIF